MHQPECENPIPLTSDESLFECAREKNVGTWRHSVATTVFLKLPPSLSFHIAKDFLNLTRDELCAEEKSERCVVYIMLTPLR